MVFFNCGFIGIKGIISDLVKEKLKDIHGNKYSDDNYSYSYNGYLSLMDYYYTIMMDNAGMANDLVHWFINMTVLEWHCLYYFCQHPPLQRSVEYIMSEVMISRRGGVDPYSLFNKELRTTVYSMTDWFIANNMVANNEYSIRLFGAGGSANTSDSYSGGGGGGWMNNDTIKLVPGESVHVNIGWTNGSASTGGTTSFGTYLSANGGGGAFGSKGGDGGSGGGGGSSGIGGIGYQFGAGGGSGNPAGGVWGGGGFPGGNGGTYGGGAGGSDWNGGRGGTYGGGGGTNWQNWRSNYGRGGTYGGNGSNNSKYGENGINTSTWTNVFNDGNTYFRGWGIGGQQSGGGGGGYGGNGGTGGIGGGGGGGYGGNGGRAGGGYGGNGGYEGGGGYGKGADGPEWSGGYNGTSGGGGGYYAKGNKGSTQRWGGGGGGARINGQNYAY